MSYIRLLAANNEQNPDKFLSLRCYDGFKSAFLITRNFNPKKEDIGQYSSYLLESLSRCLHKVTL